MCIVILYGEGASPPMVEPRECVGQVARTLVEGAASSAATSLRVASREMPCPRGVGGDRDPKGCVEVKGRDPKGCVEVKGRDPNDC